MASDEIQRENKNHIRKTYFLLFCNMVSPDETCLKILKKILSKSGYHDNAKLDV